MPKLWIARSRCALAACPTGETSPGPCQAVRDAGDGETDGAGFPETGLHQVIARIKADEYGLAEELRLVEERVGRADLFQALETEVLSCQFQGMRVHRPGHPRFGIVKADQAVAHIVEVMPILLWQPSCRCR